MTGSTEIRIAAHRRRLFIMLGVDAAAVLAAFGFILGRYRTGEDWMLAGFAAAIVIGFAAQFWMVARWWQAEKASRKADPK